MLNTFPLAGFVAPCASGILQLYNTTKTLTGDLITGDLVLTNTIIDTAGFGIYCKSLTMVGATIQNNGSDASGATGGAGAPCGTIGGGGTGGTASQFQVAPDSFRIASLGGSGGTGGTGSQPGALPGGICSYSPPANNPTVLNGRSATVFGSGYTMSFNTASHVLTPYIIWGGAGGGQGGPPTPSNSTGGGGGGGGGVILISCSGNVSLSDSLIKAAGGNGGNGTYVEGYTAGGGGGGGGGAIIIRCNSLFIKGLTDYGIVASGGVPGTNGSVSGTGAYGYILINTGTGYYTYNSGILGSSGDVALA